MGTLETFIRNLQAQRDMIQSTLADRVKYVQENRATMAHWQGLMRNMDSMAASVAKLEASHMAAAGHYEREYFKLREVIDVPALRDVMHGIDASAASVYKRAVSDYAAVINHYAREHRELREMTRGRALAYPDWADKVAAMSSLSKATLSTLWTMDFDRVGSLVAATDRQGRALARSTGQLLSNHAKLVKSISQQRRAAKVDPLAVLALPAQGVFVHTSAVHSITPHEPLEEEDAETANSARCEIAIETEEFLERTLPKLKPAFLHQYWGVKARSGYCGPDGWTQGSASMRKLLKGVLHFVAPDEVVLRWATTKNKELDKNGRPTRATKVEWVCRRIRNKVYRDHVRAELHGGLTLIALVDTALHVDEFPEFANDYDRFVLQAEMCLRRLIELRKLSCE